MALLDDVKQACRVTSTTYDTELNDLINAALADIGITDVKAAMLVTTNTPPLIKRAILTYCKLNFGEIEDGKYDRLKASYDEQKAQLLMNSAYTDWGDSDA